MCRNCDSHSTSGTLRDFSKGKAKPWPVMVYALDSKQKEKADNRSQEL